MSTYYAGIGSRDISSSEKDRALRVARHLSKKGFVLYSGNADGADAAFSEGSLGNEVAMLPWPKFNYENNVPSKSIVCGNSAIGTTAARRFHPAPKRLSQGAIKLMARNYHQIVGINLYPQVEFVVCIATRAKDGGAQGGTGQAVRIAKSLGVPVYNIRYEDEFDKLKELFF